MDIRKASIDDIELLVKLRIDFLNEENIEDGPMSQNEEDDISQKLRHYLSTYIKNGGLIVFIAQEENEILSGAFLSVADRPPREAYLPYKVGTLYNVFTYPGHRRKGIAEKVLNALIDDAGKEGVATIDLSATDSGKPLYDKLGFRVSKYTAMRLKLL